MAVKVFGKRKLEDLLTKTSAVSKSELLAAIDESLATQDELESTSTPIEEIIDFNNNALLNEDGDRTVYWQAEQLVDPPTGTSVHWMGRFLQDDLAKTAFNWKSGKMQGPTSGRPTGFISVGLFYFDTTLGKPIWWKDPVWVDATGATV